MFIVLRCAELAGFHEKSEKEQGKVFVKE